MREKLTKEEYFNLDNGIIQDITQKFIQPHIYRNQTALVTDMQKESYSSECCYSFSWDNVENLYMTDEEILEAYSYHFVEEEEQENFFIERVRDNGEDMNEIYEWYLVSDWFLARLREINEPIIDNDYGEYWGRTCTGQAIYLDHNIQELAYEWASDKRLYKNEEVA
tara:strand:+ start:91 stop:591 length:501 start_codon:yes stop_codon:yes gene_type:complete